ncbi:cupredoxin domain-containing protein [Thiohalobacter thiocyanaticus]|uniref:Cytochrome C oxidase subunit II n=1 Tax=Thiohalobacter thiocyanaticus TaxID=585455 RepID=A0A426QL22_9GAMM|nr:cytochrome C oxidase subunit II [Thiohalobacter thiocyanaticus]RRQ22397.1 cytochrome C oxidase subunit II [Thiohalobacter thiocyanaticus]
MYQTLAWQLSLILMGVLLAAFLFVALRARDRVEDAAPLISRAYRIRGILFWAILVVLTPVMLYTLIDLPYASAGIDRREAQVIEVVGKQWAWDLSTDQASVGTPVEFRVTSAAVNHGLGIYDEDMRLVAQVMAMPEYTNTLRHTFSEPGTYKLLCLEYCGMIHHDMIAELKVGAASEEETARD